VKTNASFGELLPSRPGKKEGMIWVEAKKSWVIKLSGVEATREMRCACLVCLARVLERRERRSGVRVDRFEMRYFASRLHMRCVDAWLAPLRRKTRGVVAGGDKLQEG